VRHANPWYGNGSNDRDGSVVVAENVIRLVSADRA
jgi:hypothetical protein